MQPVLARACALPMSLPLQLPPSIPAGQPTLWLNPNRMTRPAVRSPVVSLQDVHDAQERFRRFAPLLEVLFPTLRSSAGHIDSPLLECEPALRPALLAGHGGRVLIKADSALPVTGSIKARGGVYEVLAHAEDLATELGLLPRGESYAALAAPAAAKVFAQFKIAVGSTGNLGFSVGLVARTLGFQAEVHMSSDAKQWKKDRLRRHGVTVVEHQGDYSSAVAAARESAKRASNCYFIDDESSIRLFLGYAVAALDLAEQLSALDICVDASHPLVVYLPCGVGGAPGGITFGLKALFGASVRCLFVEPVQAPCMLLALASSTSVPPSIYDVGLTNDTAADGLAVPRASEFVTRTVRELVEGVATVDDRSLFQWAYRAWKYQKLRLEPSGAAGFAALPSYINALPAVAGATAMQSATHLVWTTGGSMLPDNEFDAVLSHGSKYD